MRWKQLCHLFAPSYRMGLIQDNSGNRGVQGVHEDVPRAAAAVYVWLRYSATRALTWQRSYNTQPRQLSSAQSHLVSTIAYLHGQTSGETQEWVRCFDLYTTTIELISVGCTHHCPSKWFIFGIDCWGG
jgi:hypothetical protein